MTQVMGEIVAYLVAAGCIGFLTGWFANNARFASEDEGWDEQRPDHEDLRAGISEDVNSLVERLGEQERESNETIAHMASSIEELRSLLESRSMAVSEASDDDESERASREQAARADREMDQLKHKFDELSNRHQRLQKSFGQAADRIVEYERERLSGGKWRGEDKPGPKPKRADSVAGSPMVESRPVAEPTATSDVSFDSTSEALVLEHALEIDAKDDPVAETNDTPVIDEQAAPIDLVVERGASDSWESSDTVHEPNPVDMDPQPDPIPEETPEAAQEEETGRPGAEVPLDAIDGIPDEVIARMQLLGLKTNLDLLHKCGAKGGLSGLCMSMGLEAPTVSRWSFAADLSRVRHIDAETITRLIDGGIRNVQWLATSQVDEVLSRLESTHTGQPLDEDLVRTWIEEAQELSTMIRT